MTIPRFLTTCMVLINPPFSTLAQFYRGKPLITALVIALLSAGTKPSVSLALDWLQWFKTKPTEEHRQSKERPQTTGVNWVALTASPFPTWVAFPVESRSFPDPQWWTDWRDPLLQQLLQQSFSRNLSIQQARLKLQASRYTQRATRGRELPAIQFKPSVQRQKNAPNLITPGQAQLGQGGGFAFSPGNTFNIFSAPLVANYELDLFFKNRLRTREKGFLYQADDWAYRSVITSTTTQVISTYLNLKNAEATVFWLDSQKQLLQARIALAETLLQRGLTTVIPAQQLKQQAADLEKRQLTASQQTALLKNSLAVLTGQTPAELRGMLQSVHSPTTQNGKFLSQLSGTLASPRVGLPSQLMLRRPDILQKEQQLLAAQANLSLARRAFLPDISLTGDVNYTSTELSNWIDPESFAWSLGANLVQSIFEGGKKFYISKAAKKSYEQLLTAYRESILTGFQETEDALTQFQEAHNQIVQSQEKLNWLSSELASYERQLKHGLINSDPVLRQKIQVSNAEIALSNAYNQKLQARLSLVKALGGGW
ncbi:MAG: efflux transporter outer membrane subunit [Cyanobacteria bacterium P01_H01_bin.74]